VQPAALKAVDPEGVLAVTYSIPTDGGNNKGGVFAVDATTGALRVAVMPSKAGMGAGKYTIRVAATTAADGLRTESRVVVTVLNGCSGNPCNGAPCKDLFKSYQCTCANGVVATSCDTVTLQQASSAGSSSMAGGTLVGIVVGCLFAVVIVVLIAVLLFRRRRDSMATDSELGGFAAGKPYAANPFFQAPGALAGEEAAYASFEPGMSNPLYDWYNPDLSRQETTEMLREQTEGAFVVRDSKATPGWHILGVKTNNAVVHEKIRLTEEGLYELVPASHTKQPQFRDLPELINHYATTDAGLGYTLSLSNPLYDNAQIGRNGKESHYYAPIFDDPDAPALPLKERQRAMLATVAEGEDTYSSVQDAQEA